MKEISKKNGNVVSKNIIIDGPIWITSVSDNVMKMSQSLESIIWHVFFISKLWKNVQTFVHDDINSEEWWQNSNDLWKIMLVLLLMFMLLLLLNFFLLKAPSLFNALQFSRLQTFLMSWFSTFFKSGLISLLASVFKSSMDLLFDVYLRLFNFLFFRCRLFCL